MRPNPDVGRPVAGNDADHPERDPLPDTLHRQRRTDAQAVLIGELLGDHRAGLGRFAQQATASIRRRSCRRSSAAGIDAEDRDRRRQELAGFEVGAEIGPPLQGGRGDEDPGRLVDGVHRLGAEPGFAKRCHPQAGPADVVADAALDGRLDPGVGGEPGKQDGDTERDPQCGQGSAQGPRPEAAQCQPGQRHGRGLQSELGEPGDQRRRIVGFAPTELDRLADLAVDEDQDAIGVRRSLRIVGHEDDRLPALDARAPERVEDLGPGRVVEVAGRLVREAGGRAASPARGPRQRAAAPRPRAGPACAAPCRSGRPAR